MNPKQTKISQVVKRQKNQNRQRGMKIFFSGVFFVVDSENDLRIEKKLQFNP